MIEELAKYGITEPDDYKERTHMEEVMQHSIWLAFWCTTWWEGQSSVERVPIAVGTEAEALHNILKEFNIME